MTLSWIPTCWSSPTHADDVKSRQHWGKVMLLLHTQAEQASLAVLPGI